jgi:hypothetical protein
MATSSKKAWKTRTIIRSYTSNLTQTSNNNNETEFFMIIRWVWSLKFTQST